MGKSFEEMYGIKTADKANAEKSESFVFPKESSETKKAIDKADKKINESVKIFANNLDEIEPWLTKELLDIFDNFQKDPRYSWLSESDLWLHSLWKLYEANKIPTPLESILNEMMQLLNEYKSLLHKSQTLYDMLNACACVVANENTDRKISWFTDSPSHVESDSSMKNQKSSNWSYFRPPTSGIRWRQ